MPHFAYRALSGIGELVRGETEAADQAAVIALLHRQALLPIEAVETHKGRHRWAWFTQWRTSTLAAKDLALVSQQLARLLKAGLPLDRAVEIVAGLANRESLARILLATLGRVRDGAGLAEAMDAQTPAFPKSYVSMVRAGETGGALQNVLQRAASFLARAEAMRQKVISALIYPAVLIVMAIGSVLVVLTVVLPQFEPLFQEAGVNLPTSTRIVMAAADALRAEGWLIAPCLLALAVIWRAAMRKPDLALLRDRAVLATPVLCDLITRLEIGRFCRTLGIMLTNGVAAPTALSLSGATVRNRAIAAAIGVVTDRFKDGEGLSAPLARSGRFPALSTQLIRIGEETGRLGEMLEEVAEIYEQDVQRTLERLLSLLVPGLTVVMGLIVAAIVSSILLAMISLNDLAT